MEPSILISVKKGLGIPPDLEVFDASVIVHINSVFSTLNQLGVGPENGFQIEDDAATWDSFLGDPDSRYNFLRSYMILKVQLIFDPPPTSFAIDAVKQQIAEFEWRISVLRETELWPDPILVVVVDDV